MLFYHGTSRLMDIHHPSTLFYHRTNICKRPPPQELIPIKEAEAELENLHLPSSEEEDFDAVLPLDLMVSPSLNPNSTPDYDFSNYPQFSAPCQVTYTPTPPGGHLVLSYNSRNDAFYAEPLLCAKIGLHCYNLENGTNFERLGVPEVAEHTGVLTLDACDPARDCLCKFETKVWYPTEKKDCFHVITSRCRILPPPPPEEEEKEESGFDTLSVDELFKGNMPDWLPGDSKLHYYEMKESEVEQAKEWLLLYAELAWYTKKQTDPFMFEYGKPLELRKITVQTKEVVDSMKNVKLDNAVFYISFRTRCGVVCKGVIICKRPPPQELIPIKEAEAELENLHLPSSEEEDFDAVLPLDLMISPSLNPDSTPDYDFFNYPQFSAPCQVTYTPTPPGGHLVLSYNSRNDAFYAEPLLCAKTGLHCYNLENGTNFERSRSAVPEH
ncbi:hypothetical protein Bca4012_050414 [Brassica carinata]